MTPWPDNNVLLGSYIALVHCTRMIYPKYNLPKIIRAAALARDYEGQIYAWALTEGNLHGINHYDPNKQPKRYTIKSYFIEEFVEACAVLEVTQKLIAE